MMEMVTWADPATVTRIPQLMSIVKDSVDTNLSVEEAIAIGVGEAEINTASSNTDSFAVAVAYGIKKVKMTIGTNLAIALVSSLGTFL